jgi:hypothetical protein
MKNIIKLDKDGIEVLIAVVSKVYLFWVIALYNAYVIQRFRGMYHLHLQDSNSGEQEENGGSTFLRDIRTLLWDFTRGTLQRCLQQWHTNRWNPFFSISTGLSVRYSSRNSIIRPMSFNITLKDRDCNAFHLRLYDEITWRIYCFGINYVPLRKNSLTHVKLSEEAVDLVQGADSSVAQKCHLRV